MEAKLLNVQENTPLQIVHAESDDCAAEIFTVQNGLTALSKSGVAQMAFMMPDVLEVNNPQATALVADNVPARQVTIDETQVM